MSVRGYVQTLLNPLPVGVRQPVQAAFDAALRDATTQSYVDASIASALARPITFVANGGGATLTAGLTADVYVPYNGTITAVTMLADQAGSCVVDIWKDTYANYPPTSADSITASAKPTLTAASVYRDTTLTGWRTNVSAGDVLRFTIDSVATITRLTLTLTVAA